MSAIGLYYPFLHVRDQDWLFGAALYWQKIARIVPAGFSPTDSAAIRALTGDLDLMVNVRPGPAAESMTPAFLQMLDEYGARLHTLFGLPETRHQARPRGQADLLKVAATMPPQIVQTWELSVVRAQGDR